MRTLLLVLTACGGGSQDAATPPTPFVPLDVDNRAPAPPPDGFDRTPEAIALTSGFDVSGFQFWTHARGWIHADLEDVWAALRVYDVMADRRVLDSYQVTDEGFRSDVDYSYRMANVMTVPFAPPNQSELEFDLTWLHGVLDGDLEQPDRVLVRWDKTDGAAFIDRLSGSIELEQVEPGVTEIRGVSYLRAARSDASTMEQYWQDLHADIVAVTDGEPLPILD